jgi:hypothetical protein
MARVRVPADIELEDRLAFGLTARQLALLGVTALCAYASEWMLALVLPTPIALAGAALTAAGGVALALVRHDGLRGEQLALAAARYLAAPRLRLLAPEGLPRSLAGVRAPRVGVLEPPVRRVLRSGLIELADGTHCRILRAAGSSFLLREPEEQAALVAAFGRYLNGLEEPIQLQITFEDAGLELLAAQLAAQTAALGEELARAATDHVEFLRGHARGPACLRRRRILLVLLTRTQPSALAEASLGRAAELAEKLLGAAAVTLEPLDGLQAVALLAEALEAPSPPAGSGLEGVVHAAPSRHHRG